ncbi:histidine utilization repressor [Novosphingobium sp. AP12]|uniref:histidine utilization repressor n=1 Tax=Novosphingobium sp. AP12 TaxID=1144305 RepID=UPI000271F1A7|nr:histidine utilization repressor [Novosphingobium sp. AP12]EJL24214.1 histidine utilization repressor [Novosphingobium sp. AP12]
MSATGAAAMVPLYEQVKAHVLRMIGSGELQAFSRVPSENELVRLLNVSRMTVNRALNDLASEGVLTRTAGVGTFVAEQSVRAHPLQINNIAEEIRRRGHRYHAEVLLLELACADQALAREFGVHPQAPLFHSIVLHHENERPIQIEDRYVNPVVAPDYMSADFTVETPNEHLVRVAPLQRAEHVVRAANPDPDQAQLLDMAPGEPCLVLRRRTWTNEIVASFATLLYPGSRYEFAGRFTV